MSMIINPFVFVAAGGSPTSTQWRVRFPSGNWSSGIAKAGPVQVIEIEMRATSGGVDQCTGGTASASSELSGSYLASSAFNDNYGDSGWAATLAGTLDAWIQYTFASAVTVNELVMRSATSYGPSSFVLEYYDGGEWVPHLADFGPSTWGNPETKTWTWSADYVPRAGYAKWRLYFTTGSAGTYMDILELEMRATSGGVDRCFGGTPSATNYLNAARVPSKAFNDTAGSDFPWVPASPTNGTGTYLEFDFSGRVEDITEIVITYGPDANSNPQNVAIQYYDDDTASWVTSWTCTPDARTATGQTYTSTKP